MRMMFLLAILTGCTPRPEICYPENGDLNFTFYPIPDAGDPRGERILNAVAQCLQPLNEAWLSPEESYQAECLGKRKVELRSCARIVVVPDSQISPVTGEEVFSCNIGPERCIEKGQNPTASMPCMCRASIQNDTAIFVTPNMKLAPAYAVTLMTGCLNPWTPTLAVCSSLEVP